MQGSEGGFERLGSLGPFTAVDETSSLYWVAQKQGMGVQAVNFDPATRYGSLCVVKGRTDDITGPIGDTVYSIGIFFTEASVKRKQNYLIGFGPTGFTKTVLNNKKTPSPPKPVALTSYADIRGNKAQFRTFNNVCYISPNGAGPDGHGDTPQQLNLDQKVGYDLTSWQIPPPRQFAPFPIAEPMPFTPANGDYVADGSPPPAPGVPPDQWAGGSIPASDTCPLGNYWYRATGYASSVKQESSPGLLYPPRQVPTFVTADHPLGQPTFGQVIRVDIANLYQTPDPLIDFINIYRTGGTSSVWVLIASVPIGTLFFIDNTADAALVGQNLILHQDPPPNFRAIEVHKGCMFGLGYDYPYPFNFTNQNRFEDTPPQPSDLWFAAFNQPWSWDIDGGVLPLDRGVDGDNGVGLLSIGSVLVAWKDKTTWFVVGETPNDFYAVKGFEIGCEDQDTIGGWGGLGFWVALSGVYMTNAQTLYNIADGEGGAQGNIQEEVTRLLSLPNTKFVGFCGSNAYYLFEMTTKTGWYFYIPNKSWSQINLPPPPGLVTTDPPNGLIYSLASDNSTLSLFNQTNDYLGEIQLTWESGTLDSSKPDMTKNYAYLVAVIQNGNPDDSVEINVLVDNLQVGDTPTFTLHPRAQGSSYYRLGLPFGSNGATISVTITMTQTSDVPLIVDDLLIFGSALEQLPPAFDYAETGVS